MGARDDGSFEAFASRVTPRLLRTAWLLTGDSTRAEDAAQEALVRLYVVWPRVRLDEPEAYCHRILRNHVISTWRTERRLVLVGEVRDSVGRTLATDTSGVRLDLVDALQTLPPASARWWCCATTPTCPSARSPRCSASASAP